MRYDFVSIDCEKANNEMTSLCSLGIACFKDNKIVYQKEYIIRPVPNYFYAGIEQKSKKTYHSIPLKSYQTAPTFDVFWNEIREQMEGEVIIGHGITGDFSLIQSTLNHYGIKYDDEIFNNFICTNIASIYTYPECDSHKLAYLCEYLNIKINPHHALSDAIAAGKLLIDMMNETDCKFVSEFKDICTEYNNIVLNNKYSDVNMGKYENIIVDSFNHDEKEIYLIQNNRKILVEKLMEYFYQYKKQSDDNYKLPNIEFRFCISPMIEISKNEVHERYMQKLQELKPFTNDSFLFIKNKNHDYIVYIGLIIDRTELIISLFNLLSRDIIKTNEDNEYSCAIRSYKKRYEGLKVFIKYLNEVDGIDRYDIYEFIEYFYMLEYETIRTQNFINRYNSLKANIGYEECFKDFFNLLRDRLKMVCLYDILKEEFTEYAFGLELPRVFAEKSALLYEIYYLLSSSEYCASKLEDIITMWFNNNIYIK